MKKRLSILIIFLTLLTLSCVERKVYIPTGKEDRTQVETHRAEQKPTVKPQEPKREEAQIPQTQRTEDLIKRLQSEIGDIYFDFDRYEIRPDAVPTLKKVAQILQRHPQLRLIIEGHCDERGTNEYNFALGQRRANSAKQYLVSLGVASTRIDIVSYGEEKPLCTEQNEACWQRNRRAHFVFIEEGR